MKIDRLVGILTVLLQKDKTYEGIKPYMKFWNFQNSTYHKEFK